MTRGCESAVGTVGHETDGGFGTGNCGVGDGEAGGLGATAVAAGVGVGEAAARTSGPLAVQADPTKASRIATPSQGRRSIFYAVRAPEAAG
jgi:hypothetical protein